MVEMIRTEADPAYRYEYVHSKFVPPEGKTLLILGQTLGGIQEHVRSFPEQPLPAGWAAYWGIPSEEGITNTFLSDTGGRQNHQQLVEWFPNSVIQSGLWMVGTWGVARKAGNGEYDGVIKTFGAWAKSTKRPIYLRIGYEFDGVHNELDPAEYVRAYRRIVDRLRSDGADNIAFVWHSYAAPTYQNHPIADWYPGDDYVDWVGVSVFGHIYSSQPSQELKWVLDYALSKKKPVMVAEASPIHGISASNDRAWENWFVHFFSLVYRYNIKAISFINEDWTRFNFAVSWSDARLQNNPNVANAFFVETNKERYLKQSEELFESLGYESR